MGCHTGRGEHQAPRTEQRLQAPRLAACPLLVSSSSSAPEKSAAEGGRRCLSHGGLLILRSIGGRAGSRAPQHGHTGAGSLSCMAVEAVFLFLLWRLTNSLLHRRPPQPGQRRRLTPWRRIVPGTPGARPGLEAWGWAAPMSGRSGHVCATFPPLPLSQAPAGPSTGPCRPIAFQASPEVRRGHWGRCCGRTLFFVRLFADLAFLCCPSPGAWCPDDARACPPCCLQLQLRAPWLTVLCSLHPLLASPSPGIPPDQQDHRRTTARSRSGGGMAQVCSTHDAA